MSNGRSNDVVTIALAVDDAALAERIVALLGDVAGVRLVTQADWSGARAVDADRPFAEVLHELRTVVWQAL